MAFEILKAEKQTTIDRLAQAIHQTQIVVASLGLAGVDPLDMVATNPFADLR
ncbi:hypothetical protein D9M69_653410 [compost metagenome]